jgi:hypothetical protein
MRSQFKTTTTDIMNFSELKKGITMAQRHISHIVFICALVSITTSLFAQVETRLEAAMEERVRETLKKNSEILRFMENKGQLEDKNILYYFEGKRTAVYIEKTKIRFVAKHYEELKRKFLEDESILKGTHTFTLKLDGSNPEPKLKLGSSFGTRYNYFFGEDPENWATDIYAAKDLILEDVYPGIDIRLYSSEDGELEFDWIIDSGADYHKINMLLSGQDNLTVDADGSLRVGLRFADVKFNIPESYQVTENGKVPVDFSFHTEDGGRVNFKTESEIDPSYPLIIDPVLSWGTYMDGNDIYFDQYLFAVQVDPVDGMVYCAGATNRQISTSSAPYDADGYLNVITGFGTSGTPRVAIVYRINSTGSDLVDLTLYGPSSVSSGNEVVAYGLSLSNNRVFIGGRTTVNIPTTGSPFDSVRDGNDGFIAIFSKDLGTLHYGSYLGSSGAENLGVTSIRAINDNTYVCGLTTMAALPSNYITSGVVDNTFGGNSEMYIAKFTNNNSIVWGTYVGGPADETFNDLEVFPDGRVAFAGWGNNTTAGFPAVNPASTGSNSTGDTDGLIGVLNATATAYNYVEEIGGSGNDRINDIEIINGIMAWTGSVSSGFPTSAGVYSTTHKGGTDVVVGTVSTSGGSASYKATFFGGGGNDIGSGLQKVSQTKCDGTQTSFLLVFGTTANSSPGIPTVNINNEPFYSSSSGGGLDIFFAAFTENLANLLYSTYMGGDRNDYLGDTGDPRGANHLWVKGANIYVGTTTHSSNHNPVLAGGTGYDKVKSNGNDDTHIIFSIQFSSILENDYSDAPVSYGAPSHILDCPNLRINTLDPESGPLPGINADGDDLNGIDDEDGIDTFPVYTWGGPQTISVTVNNIINTTGATATLYGWIDFNNDGVFSATEFTSTTVANGFSGSKTLNWTGVTVSGTPSNQYLRIRLTTNSLNDDSSTTNLDERSTASASNGEVEDYYICVKPNAGIDKTISCISFPGGSTTMTSAGTGNWTAQAGNPGTATITSPSSPTTTITNFSAAGTYNFIWTNSSGCATDTVSVFVSGKPNAGPDKTVSCVNIPGGSATMAATGSGTWTSQAGNPGTATITSPSSSTTTITNYSAAGTYNFIWTNASGCTDTASVFVTAKPNAGVDQYHLCVGSFPGASVTMAATGTGTWTAQAGNPGTATIVSPSSPTTTINNFSGPGNYNFIWTSPNGCTDTAIAFITAKPDAGPDKTVSCVVTFPGGSATMAASGIGTWSAQSGNPGSATITNPTSPTTTITNYSTAGTYNFIWTNASNCTDTASVFVTAKPNAGPDKNVDCVTSFPGGSTTMSATGSGSWTAQAGNPGLATIASPSSSTTVISNFSASGIYNFIWTNASGCTDTASVTVTSKPNAGPDKNVDCVASFPGGSATMSATGSGTWTTQAGNPGPATIANPSSSTTLISNFSASGIYNFIWTNASGCTDTASVTVTSKPNAGPDKNVDCVSSFPGGSATMSATGSGTWTAQAGNPGTASITSASSPTTTITNYSTTGTYHFIWTNASGCTDTASIFVTAKPNAGPDKFVDCVSSYPGGSTSMSATGSGNWTAQPGNPGPATISSPSSPTTTINNFSASGIYNFIWTNASGCTDTASVTVTSKPNAGPDKNVNCVPSFPGGSTTMNATGSGSWTAQVGNPGTANITSNTSPTTTITDFSAVGTYHFIWTNASGCTDTASVTVTSKPNAGPDKNVNCVPSFPGGSTTMNATGSGSWTAQIGNPGTANITSNTSPTTTITDFSTLGTYHFIWTNASGCTDTASITVTSKPNAGSDKNVNCVPSFPGGSATMSATGSGTWTAQAGNPGTASITSASSPTTTITNYSAAGTYHFIWTNADGCKDTASVFVTAKPNAGSDQSVSCIPGFPGGSATMSATGSGTWTAQAGNPGTASITSASSPTTTITNYSTIGTYSFIWTNADGCTDTVSVIVTAKPNAGPDKNVDCVPSFPGGSATMSATGSGTWTAQAGNPGSAIISSASSPTTTITDFSTVGTFHFIWTNGSGCSDTASVTVTAKPNAGNDKTVSCVLTFPGGSTTLTATGSGTWTAQAGNPGTATITNNTSPTTTITDFSTVGTFHFIWTNASNCTDTVSVTVTRGPIGSASPQTICSGETTGVLLASTVPGTTFTWTAAQFTGGSISGYSNCGSSCGTTISQILTNASTSIAGVVRYTITPTAPNGCVGNTFIVDVTVNPKPQGSGSAQTICSGETTNVALNSTILGSSFTWTAAQFSGSPITGFSNCGSSCGTTITQTLTNTSNSTPGVVRYTITPKSPEGCIGNTFTIDITVNPKPVGSASAQTICSGFTTNVALNSTVPASTFTWTATQLSGAVITGFSNCGSSCGTTIAQTLTNTTNNAAGVVRYTITPKSPEGCSGNTFTVDVTVNPLPVVSVNTTPACIGFSNGTATAVVSGGSSPYTYLWSNSQTSSVINNLSPGIYTVTATDSKGCKSSASGTVLESGISVLTAVPGVCHSLTNTYSLSGSITFQNAPNTGTLTVSVDGFQQIFNAPFSSPQAYVINGLTADGVVHTVTAIFSGGANCSKSTNYSAPANCSPVINHNKTFISYVQTGIYTYDVTYKINVSNSGGQGFYDLKDTPGFDDDIVINSASYTSDAPGNPGGPLAGNGPWTLADDQVIAANSAHMYTLKVNVTINLHPLSGGDNIYKKCGQSSPGNPAAGEGLFNESSLDTNNDGIAEEKSKACGDLPYVTHDKTISSINPLGANMYQVNYQIVVKNIGGAMALYDLNDLPGFDDDISINSASYTSNAPANPGGPLAGTGPWTLANDQNIAIGAIHTYQLTVKVTLDLKAGSGGDNVYRKCGQSSPGNPIAGEGLFNKSRIDTNNDGVPEETKEVCGDLPYITSTKTFVSATPLGGNMYDVTYQLDIRNLGGVPGNYNLSDAPAFDDDIAINTASFTSTAPGNPGGVLAGTGPWTLASNLSISAGALHIYTLTIKVTLDLKTGSGGDNIYKKCGQTSPGNPVAGEGLYNESRMDSNNDGIPEEINKACGDLPYVTSTKSISNIQPLGSNMYTVIYTLVVKNLGGAVGQFDLTDIPGFDDDITINSASFSTTVPGNPGGVLAGSGPWILANDQSIPAGTTYTYTLTVKVTLDLSSGSTGDNIYKKCGQSSPGNPVVGEGLYNESRMDSNNDGIPEEVNKVCGDLPYVTHHKSIAQIIPLGSNMFKVVYKMVVKNSGGANGMYDLKDTPGFDDDFTINTASYTSDAPGNPGVALVGNGPWILANDQNIAIGATHTYTLEVKVTLDLNPASAGDNVYKKCGTSTPGSPKSGEGLYNESTLDSNNDGTPEETSKVCDDVSYITHTKTILNVTNLGGNSYNITYLLDVKNLGGVNGQYDLFDVPAFDNDIIINNASYTSTASGNPGGVLAGTGPWTLANDQAIIAGAQHIYTLTVKVNIDLKPGSGGDDMYRKCGQSIPGNPSAGEGLFNESKLDSNNDGVPEETKKACGDLPYITHNKSITNIQDLGGNMYNVTYKLEVKNIGGTSGLYILKDTPGFDDDIVINSVNYTSNAPGNPGNVLAGNGPWTLAVNQNINAGDIHTYQLNLKLTLDLTSGSSGDNMYSSCAQSNPGKPKIGEGLFNESSLDNNGDGIPEEISKACGDLPYIVNTKTLISTTDLGGNMYQVTYEIAVSNNGGAIGKYDLIDSPGFDNDIQILNASYTSSVITNPGGILAGSGPWILANDLSIPAGVNHIYQLSVKVSLDLNIGSGGDNIYRKCGQTKPGDISTGEGLYNESFIDTNNDGLPENKDKVCGDLPYLTISKTVTNIQDIGDNTYNITYQLNVQNIGGADTKYDLVDAPAFDNDIDIINASFTTNAPFNPGGLLIGSGPWTLATNQNIVFGTTHSYQLTVKVKFDLTAGSGGDNVYKKCGNAVPANPGPGEGLFNEGRIDTNKDGIPDAKANVCADLPYITHTKTLSTNIQNLGGNMYSVTYNIEVKNLGGATGKYTLTDLPGFDDDITINNASFTSNVAGNPGSVLNGVGPWTLVNNQIITAGTIHTYQLVVKVTLDLSAGSSGDNIYKKCGAGTPGNPKPGEGLYNESRIDTNNDGIPEEKSHACGDLPYIVNRKSLVSATPLGGNMFQLNYQIDVYNQGGALGKYDLKDSPLFDDDITINNASYTSNVAGNPGSALVGNGPWQLANDQNIAVGDVHTYNLSIKVTLDLSAGSSGDNIYRKCGQTIPGNPSAGEGIYNESSIDTNDDGIAENKDKVCGDLPYVTHKKSVTEIAPLGGNSYKVTYLIELKNLGGANGKYGLIDSPSFDDDITISSASFTSNAPGNPGSALVGTGPWTLATNQPIMAGAIHSYTLVVFVTLELKTSSTGDNIYRRCGLSSQGNPVAGEGLFNESLMDNNNDGIPEEKSKVCADLPYVTHNKTLTLIEDLGGNTYRVTYKLAVDNKGGAIGYYNLQDIPGFDNDIAINSASYSSNAAGNPGGVLIGPGPWMLANNQAISANVTHTYQLVVIVKLDLKSGSGGDNIYRKCGQTIPGDPSKGEGLFNESKLDSNNDGIPEETDKACGDLPYVIHDKRLANITPLGGNMYHVTYQMNVRNLGGTTGVYDLTDTPGFDDDITINSATFTTTIPGVPGSNLVGTGPWLLANNQAIAVGDLHTYQLVVKVSLDLSTGSGGDNVYRKCGSTTPGVPSKGEGLFNKSTIDTNNDGIPENDDYACDDLPYIINQKSLGSITPFGGNMYQVNYQIDVRNIGGTTGLYDLTDIPGFDNDISINSAVYTSNVSGNPGAALAGTGPWILANDVSIPTGVTHSYQLSVKVTLDLHPLSAGDNVYRKCGETIPGSPSSGEGLFNRSEIDTNNDGIPEHSDKVCGDLPYVTSTKAISSITPLSGNMFAIEYTIDVKNLGGATGMYDITDAPGFDDDIAINSASFTSNVPGLPGSVLSGNGPWKLANDQNILPGVTHTYKLTIKVTLDLSPGSSGDNIYKKCGQKIPGEPSSGEGIYNELRMDSNNDGIPEETPKVCADLPYVTHEKQFTSVAPLGSNNYQIVYTIIVKNLGGANGIYDLTDAPGFDDDIAINSANYTSNAAGNPGAGLFGTGPWTLADDQLIVPGTTHTYTLTVNVKYDSSPGSGGDNVYHKCGLQAAGKPVAGEGLFNESSLDNNNDGIPEEKSRVCGDLPDIAKYGSYVWNDKNGNGQRDFGEEGLPGVKVVLYDAVTKMIERTMLTDANGKYLFENLKSKSYFAKYTLPSGWIFSPANQGPDATDSDVDGSNGPSTNATTFLDYGQESLTNDAGMLNCATISGDVWFDLDMDGIYDPNEKGINGLYVYIIDAMTGATVSTLKTGTKPGTPSDDGYYKSDCLKPGMYYVKFERPGHLGASAPYQGGNPNKDSDINHEFGLNTTTKITVNAGDVITNIGAGFQTKSQVGDRVWIDQNFNGIQDSGEKPLAGVKVSAFNKQGVKISEGVSDQNGMFMLDGMTQGDFYVKFEAPSRYSFTLPRTGADEIDSDVDGTFGYGSTRMFRVQAGEVRPTIDAGVVSQVLALEWLEFTGHYNGSFTELNWATGIEDNNHHFVIERKHDSEKDFIPIGQVAAHQNPNLARHDYQYDDFDMNKSGVYYYRLKQVDIDGRYTYSKTIAIRVNDKYDNLNVDIYPNPATDLLKLELWIPEDSELEVSVFDKNGKAVLVAPFNQYKSKGRYNELLQLSSLITGQYVLQIKTSSDVIYKKFTVSR